MPAQPSLRSDALPSNALLHQTMLATAAGPPSLGPLPARFRAAGALTCWSRWLSETMPADQLAAVSSDRVSPFMCSELICQEVERHLAPMQPGLKQSEYQDYAWGMSRLIGPCLAFAGRKGAIVEPTAALVELLGHTDITSGVPAQLFRPPFPAIYLHGLQMVNRAYEDLEGLFVFEHLDDSGDGSRAISMITVHWDPQYLNSLDMITLTITNEAAPLIDSIATRTPPEWLALIEGVAKLMLYLGVKDARMQQQTPYTDAPRNFSGLGKRKRLLRIAEIERLYDRILIGPETIPGTGPAVADGHTVAPHWRRGHFRQQPYGTGGRERRPIFIAPVVVNASALDADAPSPKTYKPTR